MLEQHNLDRNDQQSDACVNQPHSVGTGTLEVEVLPTGPQVSVEQFCSCYSQRCANQEIHSSALPTLLAHHLSMELGLHFGDPL
jgi:hypothetical protein